MERRLLAARVRLPAGHRGAARERPACTRSASTRRVDGDALDRSSRSPRAGTVAMPIDWQTIALVWDEHGYPADPVVPRLPRADAERDARRGRERRRRLRPRRGRGSRARARRDFVDRVDRASRRIPRRPGAARPCRVRARHGAARSLVVRGTALAGGGDRAGRRRAALRSTTLPAALERHDPVARPLAESSWGTGKDLRTWDSPRVADLVWAARQAELDLVAAVGCRRKEHSHGARRALRAALRGSCSRCKSSDWSFMTTRGLAGDYPAARVRDHATRFRGGDHRAAAAAWQTSAPCRREQGRAARLAPGQRGVRRASARPRARGSSSALCSSPFPTWGRA